MELIESVDNLITTAAKAITEEIKDTGLDVKEANALAELIKARAMLNDQEKALENYIPRYSSQDWWTESDNSPASEDPKKKIRRIKLILPPKEFKGAKDALDRIADAAKSHPDWDIEVELSYF